MSVPDLSTTPLAPNPSGAPPNFVNPPSLHDALFDTGVALIVVGGVFLAVRLATNLKLTRKLGLDDMLCIFAFAGGVAYWVLNILNSKVGMGRHPWDVPLSIFTVPLMQRQTAILFVIALTFWAAKSAILALYIRVLGSVTWLRRTSYFWIVFMFLFYGMNIVAAGVYCVPRKGEAWGGDSFARCNESAWLHVVVGVFSCLADLVILVLPFPVIMRLKVSLIKKVSLGIVFGTGIILVVLSIVSLYLRVQIFRGIDTTWLAVALEIVSVVEVFGTIAVSCSPAISAFWLNIFTKTTLWSQLRSTYMGSRSSLQKSGDIKPSFVNSHKTYPSSKQSRPSDEHKDSTFILRETTYEVMEDWDSRTSSNYRTARPL